MKVEMLLQEINGIRRSYEAIHRKTGQKFNIFDILNVAADETKLCRLLAELMDPKGRHYQGTLYLKLFFQYVLGVAVSEEELETASVYREYKLESDEPQFVRQRRIDLVIQTKDRIIPIEVKINAEDGEVQCADYFKIAKNSPIYYLTLDRHSPNESSKGSLINGHNLNCISFEKEILNWMRHCLSCRETIELAPIREILIQMISTIETLTETTPEEKKMEIIKVINKDEESMRAAYEIYSNFHSAAEKMIKRYQGKVKMPIYHGDICLIWKELNALILKSQMKRSLNYLMRLGLKVLSINVWNKLKPIGIRRLITCMNETR